MGPPGAGVGCDINTPSTWPVDSDASRAENNSQNPARASTKSAYDDGVQQGDASKSNQPDFPPLVSNRRETGTLSRIQ